MSAMTPELSIRLLRAKAADLENQALQAVTLYGDPLRPVDQLKADLALIAGLLADHIEACQS